MSKPAQVFVLLTGAYGNIGDALIRRRALQWVRDAGEVHAYIGSAPDDWAEQMRFSDGDVVYRSADLKRWITRCLFSPGRRALILDPGEVRLDRAALKSELFTGLLTVVVRLRGGEVIRPPRGVIPVSPGLVRFHRFASRISSLVFWRDKLSRDAVGIGRPSPDTAFQEWASDTRPLSARRLLVVSMRAHRPMLPDTTIAALKSFAEQQRLDIVCVSQVRSDEPRSEELAAALSAKHEAWGQRNDAEQESLLRSLYAESAIAVTDRLHVAILAAAIGVVPIELVPTPNGKIKRHFEQIGLLGVSVDSSRDGEEQQMAALGAALERRDQVLDALGVAKIKVDEVEDAIRRCLRPVGNTAGQGA